MYIQFNTPHQYLFYHQNVKHLFLLWKKERKREIYIVEENNDHLYLQYPGETYVDTLLHEIEPIFFQQIVSESGPQGVILGATFLHHHMLIGMYYPPPHPQNELYFFQIKNEQIEQIAEEEYEKVVQTFASEYKDYMETT